uniref:Uncharacterized protein n=1 Tax=Solanum tuberosum TaxID=4113 RepID=M1BGL5_SOLTU
MANYDPIFPATYWNQYDFVPVLFKTIGFGVDASLFCYDHRWSQYHCCGFYLLYVYKLARRFFKGQFIYMLLCQVSSFHLLGIFHAEIFVGAII